MFITVPSGSQWLLIVVMVLLLFGAKRLPDIASSFGESIRRFKEAYRGERPRDAQDDRGERPRDAQDDRGERPRDTQDDRDVSPEG